jgi:hypothetical protein
MLRIPESFESPYHFIHNCISNNQSPEESSLDLELTKTEILKDIPRTHLLSNNKKEQQQLLRILLALAYIKPSIGYCQGMNFLGAVLLKVVKSEEISFLLLLGMIKKWDMENMFVPGVPDLSLREYQMDYFLKSILPDLYHHFHKVGITNGFFITRWFMTLFSTYLPFDTLLRVWDCFFLDGWRVIIKFSLALLREIRPVLLDFDMEEISSYLRKADQINYRSLLSKSRWVRVSNLELKKIEEQFYTEQATLKLVAVENSHSMTDKELKAIRWAKTKFETFDGITKKDVSEFWRKIEKLDGELENFSKHFLMVSMDFLRVRHDLEILAEKQKLYLRNFQEIQNEYKKIKFPGFFMKLLPKINKKSVSAGEVRKFVSISEIDVKMCEEKLLKVNLEMQDLQKQYKEKACLYRDVFIRSQEIRERKKIYSEQLCDFINIYH